MSRINLKIFKLSWWQWLLILVFVWLLSVLWPVKGFLLPQHWWGQSLIVVMNDNEARPCGGFATAYGVLDLPLIQLDIGSTYELDTDLGPAPAPLDKVSERLKFWDLGTSMDLNQCAEDFKAGYLANTDEPIDRVILVQMSFLESWAQLLDNDTFFADISRQVANVDHHDEKSLDRRKDPAGEVMGDLVKQSLNPFKWKAVSKLIKKSEKNHYLYWQNKTRSHSLATNNVVQISEWNLGGGKSSRYLRKDIKIDIRETTTPGQFDIVADLHTQNLGGLNQPISQTWKGVFDINLLGDRVLRDTDIDPGTSRLSTIQVGPVQLDNKIILKKPAYQDWNVEFSLSLLAEQKLASSQLQTREGVGTWSGIVPPEGLLISWESQPDTTPPFLTLHKPIDPNFLDTEILEELEWSEENLITELHFNEPINLIGQAYTMELADRDFAAPEVSEDLTFKGLKLLADQTTLLINWEQNEYQKDERYYLNLNQIEDVWGNTYKNEPRTIITR